MSPTEGVVLLFELLCLLWLSAVFSGSETGIYTLSRVKLRYKLRAGSNRARIVNRLLRPLDLTIITILIGNNIVNELLSAVAEEAARAGVGPAWSVPVTIVVLTPLLLVFSEFMPKQLFRTYADRWVYRLAWVLYGLRLIMWPAVMIIRGFTWLLQHLVPGAHQEIWEPHTSRPNLRTFLSTENSKHNLGPVQKQLVDRILALERLDLGFEGASKPLSSVESLDAGATIAAAKQGLGPKFYQRYLVRSHDDGKPIGYISAATLATADGQNRVGELAQDLPTMPVTTPLHVALQRMHASGADLALVTDANGEANAIAFRGDCLRILVRME